MKRLAAKICILTASKCEYLSIPISWCGLSNERILLCEFLVMPFDNCMRKIMSFV
jgi:hypothetical protein